MKVITEQRPVKKPGIFRIGFRLMLLCGIFAISGIIFAYLFAAVLDPPELQVDQATVFYDANEEVIGESQNGQHRYWMDIEGISQHVINATVAIEDKKFFEHDGFDYPRIAAALLTNIRLGSKAQGASTITQQYARNLYLSHDKTWERKIEEAIYALRLEIHYDKDDILQGYLNTIYYGHGAYGIEAASRHYFDKSASDLSLAESAMLAGIPKGPSNYSPFLNQQRAKKRQRIVLAAMEENGYITAAERREAVQTELSFNVDDRFDDTRIGPYFQDEVERRLVEVYDLDPQLVESGGLNIHTTLDADLQRKAEKWIDTEMPEDSSLQGALVSLDPQTGDVRAMVGGKSYKESPYNRVTRSKRSPGSTLKPFLYYSALQQGFTPVTSFISEPTTFPYGTNGEEEYSPGNFGDIYANDFITMAEALAVSDNIFAVKTHLYLGPDTLVQTAKDAGIDTPLSPNPSLALGSESVNVLDLASAYNPFANGGYRTEPRLIEKVTNGDGEVILETEVEREQTLDPKHTYIVTDMMKGMFDVHFNSYTSVTGRSIAHLINRPLAGKSGSTNYDSWMIGFAPQLTTAVWVGYDDNQVMDHSAQGQISKRIWAQYMNDGLAGELKRDFAKPNGVIEVAIDTETHLLGSEACGPSRTMAFVKGTEPQRSCTDEIEAQQETGKKDPDGQLEDELPEKEDRFFDKLKRWVGQ